MRVELHLLGHHKFRMGVVLNVEQKLIRKTMVCTKGGNIISITVLSQGVKMHDQSTRSGNQYSRGACGIGLAS